MLYMHAGVLSVKQFAQAHGLRVNKSQEKRIMFTLKYNVDAHPKLRAGGALMQELNSLPYDTWLAMPTGLTSYLSMCGGGICNHLACGGAKHGTRTYSTPRAAANPFLAVKFDIVKQRSSSADEYTNTIGLVYSCFGAYA